MIMAVDNAAHRLPECEHNRIFARRYKTVLPSADTFKRIIRQHRMVFEEKSIAAKYRGKP